MLRPTSACRNVDSARSAGKLFDGDGFSEVTRLVHIAATADRNVISEKLKRDNLEKRHEQFRCGR